MISRTLCPFASWLSCVRRQRQRPPHRAPRPCGPRRSLPPQTTGRLCRPGTSFVARRTEWQPAVVDRELLQEGTAVAPPRSAKMRFQPVLGPFRKTVVGSPRYLRPLSPTPRNPQSSSQHRPRKRFQADRSCQLLRNLAGPRRQRKRAFYKPSLTRLHQS